MTDTQEKAYKLRILLLRQALRDETHSHGPDCQCMLCDALRYDSRIQQGDLPHELKDALANLE